MAFVTFVANTMSGFNSMYATLQSSIKYNLYISQFSLILRSDRGRVGLIFGPSAVLGALHHNR